METINIKPSKVNKITKVRELHVQIINGLDINLDCDVELLGNSLTIWVREKKEENAKSN